MTRALFDSSNAELPVLENYCQHIEVMCGVSFLPVYLIITCHFNSELILLLFLYDVQDLVFLSLTENDIEQVSKPFPEKVHQD